MDRWKAFWAVIVDVWENGLYGIDIGRIIVAVFIVLGFLIIRRLFTRLVVHRISLVTQKTSNPLDDKALEVLQKPVSFISVVLGVYFATEYLNLSGNLEIFADRLVRSLIVFVIFWGLVKLVQPMSVFLRGLEKVFTTPIISRRGIQFGAGSR